MVVSEVLQRKGDGYVLSGVERICRESEGEMQQQQRYEGKPRDEWLEWLEWFKVYVSSHEEEVEGWV